jgi:hypothetical protein
MSMIPIYDDTAPIACTIGREEVPERIELVERMKARLRRIDRTDHGLLLHFPDQPAVEADLRQFTVDEKRCCQFWGFAVETGEAGLVLRWDGPPATNDLLDLLHGYFAGDEPLSAITGLL